MIKMAPIPPEIPSHSIPRFCTTADGASNYCYPSRICDQTETIKSMYFSLEI